MSVIQWQEGLPDGCTRRQARSKHSECADAVAPVNDPVLNKVVMYEELV